MGVQVRQKGGKWYVFINHQGERKAKCIGDDKRLALQAMAEHYPQYYAYFFTLARTGMRAGEAFGLAWEDIQFGTGDTDPHRFIEIRRTYDSVHNRMNTPKSGKSRRVDMSKALRTCLMDWRELCFEQAVMAGKTALEPVVFATRSGRPWAPVRTYHVHKRVCAHAGLHANRIHDLRHSYATIMLYELHLPIQYVSEQLGHSSIKITVDTYGHPRQGMSTHLVDQLDTSTQLSATLMQPCNL